MLMCVDISLFVFNISFFFYVFVLILGLIGLRVIISCFWRYGYLYSRVKYSLSLSLSLLLNQISTCLWALRLCLMSLWIYFAALSLSLVFLEIIKITRKKNITWHLVKKLNWNLLSVMPNLRFICHCEMQLSRPLYKYTRHLLSYYLPIRYIFT